MKTPLLIGVSALVLLASATLLFAQTTTGSSLITQMKAATHAFTLTADLNSGATGLESAPLVGKRTGDMLSAGEYNRILELVGQGGGGGGGLKICGENENCPGTPLLCGAVAPDSAQTVSSLSAPIVFGSWANSQCGTSGTGWHSGLSSCSTATGNGLAQCRWVLVDTGGGGGGTGGGGFNWDACTPEWVGTPKNGTPYTNAAGLKCKYTGASGPGALDSTYYLCCPGS